MQCSNCKERFRRPFAKLHDCSDVYEARLKKEKEDYETRLKEEKDMLEARLKEERDRLAEAQRTIALQEKQLRDKEIKDLEDRE